MRNLVRLAAAAATFVVALEWQEAQCAYQQISKLCAMGSRWWVGQRKG
jgi:hypothetical protein